jgi:FkbM family methyltransferase
MTEEDLKKEIFEQKVYGDITGKDLIIFDIGACSGFFTIFAHPHAKIIYAFEPYSLAIKNFKEHTKGLDKIKLITKAVSDVTGTIELYEDSYAGQSIVKNKDQKVCEMVDSIILYDFIKENNIDHIDFLKIDVECAEINIFNSKNFDKVLAITDKIALETHGHNEVLKPILENNNFKVVLNGQVIIAERIK